MMNDNFGHLGSGETKYEYQVNPELLETFTNPYPDRQYKVVFTTQEVTSLCPITGQPDFYRITITYIPARQLLGVQITETLPFQFSAEWDVRRDHGQPYSGRSGPGMRTPVDAGGKCNEPERRHWPNCCGGARRR